MIFLFFVPIRISPICNILYTIGGIICHFLKEKKLPTPWPSGEAKKTTTRRMQSVIVCRMAACFIHPRHRALVHNGSTTARKQFPRRNQDGTKGPRTAPGGTQSTKSKWTVKTLLVVTDQDPAQNGSNMPASKESIVMTTDSAYCEYNSQ